MRIDIIGDILEIYKSGSVNISYLRECYPALLEAVKEEFGSLKNAVLEAGLDYYKFISGFLVETSPSFNRTFINAVTKLFEKKRIFLDKQFLINFDRTELDPIRVDLEHSRWYIIKILPWSNLTQKLLTQIVQYTEKKILIIYYMKRKYRPKLDFVVFNHVEKYLKNISRFDKIRKDLGILRFALNVIKIELL